MPILPVKRLLNVFPILLSFLIPVFFLPLTSEFFEFNKLALISAVAIIMLLFWVATMVKEGKVEVTKSPLDLGIGLFAVVLILSTVFSLNKHASIFGASGRWFPSLLGFVVLAAFYYVSTSNISSLKTVRAAINAAIAGMTVSSIVALVGYFGFKFGSASYLQIPNFTLTGSTTTAGVFAALAAILCINKILTSKNESSKFGLVALFILNVAAATLLGTGAVWATLGAGLLTTAYLTKPTLFVQNKVHLSAAFAITIVMILALVLPVTRNLIVTENYPKEIKITPKESWTVVSSILGDFPVLGTGPSTFNLSYTRFKPLSVNNTDYWNIRFDKPYNEAFNAVAGLGILGLAVVLGLAIKTVKFTLDTKHYASKEYSTLLASGVLAVMAALLFTYATVALAFMLVLFLALLVVVGKGESSSRVASAELKLASLTESAGMSLATMKSIKREKEVFQYIMAVPLTALALTGGFYLTKTYAAEYYFRRAILSAQAGDGRLTYEMQQKTIRANAQRDTYQNAFATTNLALAESLSAKQDLTDEERSTIQTLVAQSIRGTRVSTEILNPLNAANWETRAGIYRALIGAAQDADKWAIRAYTNAIQLDPANPRLRVALGGVYYASQDYLSAANLFTQATSLKTDYANAHYNLAQALKQLERYDQAKIELETTQRLVAAGSDDSKKVAMELEEIAGLINVAGAATSTTPTISELEGDTDQTPTEQEPLVNEGEEVSTTPETTESIQ